MTLSFLPRRFFLTAPALAAPLLLPPARRARSADYPAGTIRIVAPGPAGSPRDLRARWVAEQLGPALDRPVIVDNKPGAGGNIGMEVAARSPADGRTLVLVDVGTLAQNPHVYGRPGYDARADFAPIIILVEAPLLLAVPLDSPVRTVSDLVTLARSTPGKLSFGSPGVGTPPHLAAEVFNRAAGLEVLHVPYKGAAPAIQDLMANRLDYVIDSVALLQPLATAGKVRAVALTGKTGLDVLPGVPTFAASGWPEVVYLSWTGLAAPAGTPKDLVARVNQVLTWALASEPAQAWFRREGATIVGGSPADFAHRIDSDHRRWEAVIRRAGIVVE